MAAPKRGRPATTPEDREMQLQNLAYDLAEEQLRSGKASSQVITMLMKSGSTREQIEIDKLRSEKRLLEARIEGLESAARMEASIEAAMEAFKTYTGEEPGLDDD
jgi:hypothetical protein